MDIVNDDEIEKEETLRFIFTLPAMRLYEQKTGRNFFDDYHKAFNRFIELMKNSGIETGSNTENLTTEQQLQLLPLVSDPMVLNFVLDAVTCLYAEVLDGKFVQNEETTDVAENSLWLMDLVNAEFFGELLSEISANQGKTPKGKAKGKKR